MNILINYFSYCVIVWCIFIITLSFYWYYDNSFIKKYKQYKRIIKKLDYKIENAVVNRCYGTAERYYKKLEKVNKIWEGV